MIWVEVKSKNLSAIGYNAATQTAGAKFVKGGTYHYSGVPESVYDSWEAASSKGAYFSQNIKDKYPSTKVGVSMEAAG